MDTPSFFRIDMLAYRIRNEMTISKEEHEKSKKQIAPPKVKSYLDKWAKKIVTYQNWNYKNTLTDREKDIAFICARAGIGLGYIKGSGKELEEENNNET